MTVTHNLVSYIVIKITNAQLQKKSNRSYLYKSFHIRRSTDALSRQLAAHNVGQIHNIAQHEMVLDIQKTNTLQQLISQEQNYKCKNNSYAKSTKEMDIISFPLSYQIYQTPLRQLPMVARQGLKFLLKN